MSDLTTNRDDPRLGHGADSSPVPQNEAYLVLSEEERSKGFIRPVRHSYRHTKCQIITTMSAAIAETYSRKPTYYSATYCCGCSMHLPVAEFTWMTEDGRDTDQKVGS